VSEVVIDGVRYVPDNNINVASFWYMHDNHTFSRLKGSTLEELAESGFQHGLSSSDGSLCPVTIIGEDDKEKRRAGLMVHHSYRSTPEQWRSEVDRWKSALEADEEVMMLIKKGRLKP
jgi:hypothetical protein